MTASIIIPTKNKVSRLRLVLQALTPQLNDDIEVIIIMDGCSDSAVQDIKQLTSNRQYVLIECSQNIKRAAARNKGIKAAKGAIIIFLDDDRIPEPDFVQKHIAYHMTRDCVVIGGRYQLNYPEKEIEDFYESNKVINDFKSMIDRSTHESFSLFRILSRLFASNIVNSISFMTGNASVKRTALLKAGLFDENFTGWGFEDVDIGYRLSQQKIKFIRDYSILNYHLEHHFTRQNQEAEYKKSFQYFISKIKKDKIAAFIIWSYFHLTYFLTKIKSTDNRKSN